jgi:hypothetical protein
MKSGDVAAVVFPFDAVNGVGMLKDDTWFEEEVSICRMIPALSAIVIVNNSGGLLAAGIVCERLVLMSMT